MVKRVRFLSKPGYFRYCETLWWEQGYFTWLLSGRLGNPSSFASTLTSREGGVPCPSRMEVGIQPSTRSGRGASLPPGGLKVSAPHSAFAAGCAWGSPSGGVWLEKNSYYLNVFLPRQIFPFLVLWPKRGELSVPEPIGFSRLLASLAPRIRNLIGVS